MHTAESSDCGTSSFHLKHSKATTSTHDSHVQLTEWGYQREAGKLQEILACELRVALSGVRAMKQLGSGVLDLCYVAAGRLDAVYAGVAGERWWPWDYAPGVLLVAEAGGVLCCVDGQPFHTHAESVLAAATPELRNELLEVINKK